MSQLLQSLYNQSSSKAMHQQKDLKGLNNQSSQSSVVKFYHKGKSSQKSNNSTFHDHNMVSAEEIISEIEFRDNHDEFVPRDANNMKSQLQMSINTQRENRKKFNRTNKSIGKKLLLPQVKSYGSQSLLPLSCQNNYKNKQNFNEKLDFIQSKVPILQKFFDTDTKRPQTINLMPQIVLNLNNLKQVQKQLLKWYQSQRKRFWQYLSSTIYNHIFSLVETIENYQRVINLKQKNHKQVDPQQINTEILRSSKCWQIEKKILKEQIQQRFLYKIEILSEQIQELQLQNQTLKTIQNNSVILSKDNYQIQDLKLELINKDNQISNLEDEVENLQQHIFDNEQKIECLKFEFNNELKRKLDQKQCECNKMILKNLPTIQQQFNSISEPQFIQSSSILEQSNFFPVDNDFVRRNQEYLEMMDENELLKTKIVKLLDDLQIYQQLDIQSIQQTKRTLQLRLDQISHNQQEIELQWQTISKQKQKLVIKAQQLFTTEKNLSKKLEEIQKKQENLNKIWQKSQPTFYQPNFKPFTRTDVQLPLYSTSSKYPKALAQHFDLGLSHSTTSFFSKDRSKNLNKTYEFRDKYRKQQHVPSPVLLTARLHRDSTTQLLPQNSHPSLVLDRYRSYDKLKSVRSRPQQQIKSKVAPGFKNLKYLQQLQKTKQYSNISGIGAKLNRLNNQLKRDIELIL